MLGCYNGFFIAESVTVLSCVLLQFYFTLNSYFACVGLATAVSMIQSIINDHKREKREQEKDKRDLEYHEKRMKNFK